MKKFEEQLIKEVEALKSLQPGERKGNVGWESPSNIAFVKYWGKYPRQIPANASLSLTLSKAVTRTRAAYNYDPKREKPVVQFEFEGQRKGDFTARIEKYLSGLDEFMPWIRHTDFSISSENTFPHSSGIASSASAMSAMALCLCDIEQEIYRQEYPGDFFRRASFLARLGSGSASRSLYGKMAEWGITASCKDSSDEFAIPVPEIHDAFMDMKDSILIIESGKKRVSSSLGHDLMRSNPYSKLRFEAAEENMQQLCNVMQNGDLGGFIDIMENEALSLHAMMMTSSPGYVLMQPNSLEAIHRIREFRSRTGLAIGFTLDAGANVHVIYPGEQAESIRKFIDQELKELCEHGAIIHDEMGSGPKRI